MASLSRISVEAIESATGLEVPDAWLRAADKLYASASEDFRFVDLQGEGAPERLQGALELIGPEPDWLPVGWWGSELLVMEGDRAAKEVWWLEHDSGAATHVFAKNLNALAKAAQSGKVPRKGAGSTAVLAGVGVVRKVKGGWADTSGDLWEGGVPRPLASERAAKSAYKLLWSPRMPPKTAQWKNIGDLHCLEARERLAGRCSLGSEFTLLMQSAEILYAWRTLGACDAEADALASELADRLDPELQLVLGAEAHTPRP